MMVLKKLDRGGWVGWKKGTGSFYIAQYPVRWTAQSALHVSSPGRPVHSDINSATLGSYIQFFFGILSTLQSLLNRLSRKETLDFINKNRL